MAGMLPGLYGYSLLQGAAGHIQGITMTRYGVCTAVVKHQLDQQLLLQTNNDKSRWKIIDI